MWDVGEGIKREGTLVNFSNAWGSELNKAPNLVNIMFFYVTCTV